MSDMNDDPFSAEADPYPLAQRIDVRSMGSEPHDCQCGHRPELLRGPALSRRQALFGVGALAGLPVLAAADPFPVPCVQEQQQITPCRHKFCKHYAGRGDYYGRPD